MAKITAAQVKELREKTSVGMMDAKKALVATDGDMEKAIELLEEVKESIINAYELKTGLSRNKLSDLMDAETWFNAKKAVELGFVDRILFAEGEEDKAQDSLIFSQAAVTNSLLDRLKTKIPAGPERDEAKPISNKVSAKPFIDRLSIISH